MGKSRFGKSHPRHLRRPASLRPLAWSINALGPSLLALPPRQIVQRCLEAIKYLGREGPNCRRLGEAGACDLVVESMRGFPGDRGAQLWGCGSVFNLASNTRENKRRLMNLGIAPLLIAAMRAFPEDEEIQVRPSVRPAMVVGHSAPVHMLANPDRAASGLGLEPLEHSYLRRALFAAGCDLAA
jgi:hypothetical protein